MAKKPVLRFGIDHLPECKGDCPTCQLSLQLSQQCIEIFIELCAVFYGADETEVRMACAVSPRSPVSFLRSALSAAAVRKIEDSVLFTDIASILAQPVAALSDLPGFREDWIGPILQWLRQYQLYTGPAYIEKGTPERYIPLKDLSVPKIENKTEV